MKDSHFKTPRMLRDASFNGNSHMEHQVVTNRVRDWILAMAIGVMIGVLFALGVR